MRGRVDLVGGPGEAPRAFVVLVRPVEAACPQLFQVRFEIVKQARAARDEFSLLQNAVVLDCVVGDVAYRRTA